MKEYSEIMKGKVRNYKLVKPKTYQKTCNKCGAKFNSESKNKRLCTTCKKENNTHKNNLRVRQHYKKYGKNRNRVGTGFLGEHPLPPLKEIDAIIDEMRNLDLL